MRIDLEMHIETEDEDYFMGALEKILSVIVDTSGNVAMKVDTNLLVGSSQNKQSL